MADEEKTPEARAFAVEGNDLSGYVGVSPEYRTYANETDKPMLSDDEKAFMKERGLLTDEELAAENEGQTVSPAGEVVKDEASEDASEETPEDPKRDADTKTTKGNELF